MSNRRERLAIEALIVKEYQTLLECLAERGLTTSSDYNSWGEGAKSCFSRFNALGSAAIQLGMGDYTYDRVERVISGEQYSTQRL